MRFEDLIVRTFLLVFVASIALAMTTAMAIADDWTVVRMRGAVQQQVDGQWQPLKRGSVVSDERLVATRSNGYATLVRGNEAIELEPNTQIAIYDKGGRKPFTTVLQYAGQLTVEAEVRNVQHFAVRTAYLAAVVKGTRFTVTAKKSGGSVQVLRGQVSVEDKLNQETVMVLAGQTAKVTKGSDIAVSGKPKAVTGTTSSSGKSGSASGSSGKSGESNGNGNAYGHDKDKDDKSNNGNHTGQVVETVVETTTTVVNTATSVVSQTTSTVTETVSGATGVVTGLLGKNK